VQRKNKVFRGGHGHRRSTFWCGLGKRESTGRNSSGKESKQHGKNEGETRTKWSGKALNRISQRKYEIHDRGEQRCLTIRGGDRKVTAKTEGFRYHKKRRNLKKGGFR